MKKIRVLHIITGLNTGGAEMMLYKLITNSDKERFLHLVLSLQDEGTMGKELKSKGFIVIHLNLNNIWLFLKSLKPVSQYIKNFNPDIIQGWMYHGNLFSSLLSNLLFGNKIPVLWNIRQSLNNLSNEKTLTYLIIKLTGILSKRPIKIINNSKYSAIQHSEIINYDSQKNYIIPNGFDLDLFKPIKNKGESIRNELGIKDTTFLVGLIGRFDPVKDHGNFLDAANLIKSQLKDVHFLLVGRNIDNNEFIMNKVRESGLEKNTTLLGERHDIPRITSSLDVAVSSSYAEGFSNTIGEAMACGVPCVVTNVGDSAWIVGNQDFVVEPKNPVQLAEKVCNIAFLDEQSLTDLKKQMRQRIEDNFSISHIVKQYEDLYKSICKG